ncbi:MAG: hypothetical protein ACYDAJ_07545 [Nitrosotalea sp.]
MTSHLSFFDSDVRKEDLCDNEICPNCKLPFSEHTNNQIVKCALEELGGES